FPTFEATVRVNRSANINNASRAKIGPGKFFLSCPDDFDWFFCSPSEPSSFDCRFAGVLAAITGAGVRREDVDTFNWDAKRRGELLAYAKRALRAGPNRELVAGPFGERGAGFERGVSDVGDSVACIC